MAYINVAEWKPDMVTEWVKGLDDSMSKYINSFTKNRIDGRQLLHIRPYELEQLGMRLIGHQEILLSAVEKLRNFHYNLDKENLQFMALHVATAAGCLYRQLAIHCDASKIETHILNDITRTVATIKPLISWLDRDPFQGQVQFTEIRRNMLRLGLEMATIAQRDRFVERPVEQIKKTAEKLERLANYIIQDITDPMILQPASLNLVTLKKRESELGVNIEPSYHGIHRVIDIKHNSPAHNSGKIEVGDEIVQINYQTVVGWQYKTVLLQLSESLPDVLLTLKKRPKHTKIYGQIYMQPYRLPSKKRAIATRWGDNLPSPRAGFLTVPNMTMSLKSEEKSAVVASSDTDSSSCSDISVISTPTDTKATEKQCRRLFNPKPCHSMLQRRNTISGDEMLRHKYSGNVPLWLERKVGGAGDQSPSLRDKSISFGFGLEIQRPTTCIGIANAGKFGSEMDDLLSETKKLKEVLEMQTEPPPQAVGEVKSKPGVSKVVRFDANMKCEDYPVDDKYTCNVQNTILETYEPILFADEDEEETLTALETTSDEAHHILEALDQASKSQNITLTEAVNKPIVTRRGRLDKSHSTPAYDNSGEESDTPPAIEPRKEFLLQTPPVPPPRPRKPPNLVAQLNNSIVNTPSTTPSETSNSSNNHVSCTPSQSQLQLQPQTHVVSTPDAVAEVNELHTPTKTKTLTLKKKHSLIAKRRNINLHILGTGDIQGHLYRRTKDRRGVTFWARFYFVMLDTILYGFRKKESPKASCVIFLPGFTVSPAKEVHSKPHAFKVYHSEKTFYFAAESLDALNQWVDFIRQATQQAPAMHISINGHDCPSSDVNTKDLFSETDSSGEESESMITKNLCTPSPQGNKDLSSSFNNGSKLATTPTSSGSKHERGYLGSLRKLTKGSLPFKSSTSDKKPSSDIPVPTEQYRSYRKVPGGSFGIQIGTNTPGYHDTSSSSLTSPIALPSPIAATPSEKNTPSQSAMRKHSLSSSRSSIFSNSDSIPYLGPPSSPAPIPHPTIVPSVMPLTSPTSSSEKSLSSPSKEMKKTPYNFIHASNPNLVEFDFQTSKTLDYSLPKINSANSWDAHPSILGFVTLKDLMLQKQEEEKQEMYNNRVLLGVEKKYEHNKRHGQRRYDSRGADGATVHIATSTSGHTDGSVSGCGGKLSKTQSRSLPKTPDYEISFKPDDEDIRRTRTKEGLKLRDFGYELISGDEPLGGPPLGTSRQNSNTSTSSCDHAQCDHNSWSAAKRCQFLKLQQSTNKGKKHSSNSCCSSLSGELGSGGKRAGSLKKKSKLSSDRIFQFSKHSSGSASGIVMTLPHNKKSNHSMESSNGSGSGIKKSHTYNNDLKEKAGVKYDAHRKNSAPMPIFAKLSFSSGSTNSASNTSVNSKIPKEKRILGSPLLHRTIFGNQNQHGSSSGCSSIQTTPTTCTGREYDTEIFSQVIFPKVPNHHHQHTRNFSNATMQSNTASIESNTPTPEYPNMECPPVFEPEIYSLTEPNATSLAFLRRNNSNATDDK